MWINRDKKTKTVEKRTDMENKKLTKLEKYWIMYDVGNSAFVMLIATIIPIYFNYLEKNGITSWSEESSKAFAEIASGETERSKEDPLYDTAGPWDYGDQYYPEHVLRYYHS